VLNIQQAEYVWDDNYPLMRLIINGHEVLLHDHPKPTWFLIGFVYLGGEFQNLHEFTHAVRIPDGGPITLRGFARDRRVWICYERFLSATADGTFEPGPVDIP